MSRKEVYLEEKDGFDPDEVITEVDARWYPHEDGIYVPSTTTVLDEIKNRELQMWIDLVGKESANKIAYQASTNGTAVHDICEDIARQLMFNGEASVSWLDEYGRKKFNSQVWEGVIRFMDFVDNHVAEFLYVEEKLTSMKMFVGGRMDAIVRMNDDRVGLIDYKFSNALSPNYTVQTYIYEQLSEECLGISVDFRANLWLKAKTRGADKTGKVIQGKKWQLVEHTDPDRDAIVFKAAHDLFMDRFRTKKLKPEIHQYPAHIKITKNVTTNN